MLKKVKNFLPVMGLGVITAFSQLTMSGSQVSFEAEELSNIGSNLTSGLGSAFGMTTQLVPYMILLTLGGIFLGVLFGIGKLRIGKGRVSRIGR